jgi:predicted RNA-binding Zn ribbon-like protein
MTKLCLDFLNTRWYLTHKLNKEILTDPKLLKEFLKEHQLHIETPPSIETTDDLLKLRTYLAKALEDYAKDSLISLENLTRINHYLSIPTCRRILEQTEHGFQITIQPLSFDWHWIIAEILMSFAEIIQSDNKGRVKFCENPDCKWFFYDETKSRTKRWCSDKCASLMKVRKFRAKQKEGIVKL